MRLVSGEKREDNSGLPRSLAANFLHELRTSHRITPAQTAALQLRAEPHESDEYYRQRQYSPLFQC